MRTMEQHQPIKRIVFGYRLGDKEDYTPLKQEKSELVRVFTAERVPAKESHIVEINGKARKHNMK
jgi:hypothetical protein